MINKYIIKEGQFRLLALIIFILTPFLVSLVSLGIGRMYIPIAEIVNLLRSLIQGIEVEGALYSVIVNLRLPRIIMALIVGAGMSCAGATFQSLFSNPLATPDILGVTSATSVGAILAILMSMNLLGTQIIALAFGLLSVAITINIARDKTSTSVVVLVLAGVIISSLFNAIGSLLKYTADPMDKLPEITYWLMGSFSRSGFKTILVGSPFIIIGIVMIFLLRWKLNLLSLSEEEAKSTGIDIKRTRLYFILASTMITASAVAMCGQIGWMGLIVPHVGRMITGANNRFLIPVAISLGASFMVIIETLSRTVSKIELPLSVLTAIIGAPVFITLLRRTRGNF